MKRLLIIPVLAMLWAPTPAQAGWDLWPLDGTAYCSSPQSDWCFRPDLKDEYKQKKAAQKYRYIDERTYKQLNADYRKTALRKPPRAVPDPRVK